MLRQMLIIKIVTPCWFWIRRAFDATPHDASFGALAEMARPIAHYWWKDNVTDTTNPSQTWIQKFLAQNKKKDEPAKWHKLTYEEYRRRQLSKKEPVHGTLHLTAQALEITWSYSHKDVLDEGKQFNIVQRENLLVPPSMSGEHDASTIFRSLEQGEEQLQWQKAGLSWYQDDYSINLIHPIRS